MQLIWFCDLVSGDIWVFYRVCSRVALWPHYLLTYLLTYLVIYILTYLLREAESFWESTRFSASIEIPPILWNPKVYYGIHQCQPPVHILIHIETLHVLTSHFLKIHPNIVPSTPGFSKLSFSLGFSHQNPSYTYTLPHTCYMLRQPQFYQFHPPNNTHEQYTKHWTTNFKNIFCISDEYVINLFVGIYEVRKGA